MSVPPSASKVVCIDFDGTIAPWGPLMDLDPPFPGVAQAMKSLSDAGYRIVILTSRLSHHWWDADHDKFGYGDPLVFGLANLHYVTDYLSRWVIPFDEITCEKVPAAAYFDDKAVRVNDIGTSSKIAHAIGWFLRGRWA